jgi:hypothetical protein
VDVSFAGFFCESKPSKCQKRQAHGRTLQVAKWLGRQSYLDDLASLDPELYKGLVQLKNYPGNPEDLSLNFTVAEEEFGVTRSIDLVPGGSDIAVTRVNRMECESTRALTIRF